MVGPSRALTAPAAASPAASAALTPPSGPTITTISPRARQPQPLQRGRRFGIQDDGQAGRGGPGDHLGQRHRPGHVREPAAARLLGRFARGTPPAVQRLGRAVAAPLHHAALSLPGQHHVRPDLGHQLNRQLSPVALGNRLNDHDARLGRRFGLPGQHPELNNALGHRSDHALGDGPCPIGHVSPLASGQPPHGPGVPALGAAQHYRILLQRSRISDEHRRPQRWSLRSVRLEVSGR